jgi:hypothetical protein
MLSGWDGPWITGVPIQTIGVTMDPLFGTLPNALVLTGFGDAVKDYGLTPGDFITISGATNPSNNGQFVVQRFLKSLGIDNHIILLESTVVPESPTAAVMAMRSKYDTFPIGAGVKMTPKDVDVARHEFLRNTFLVGVDNTFRLYVTASTQAKDFIESQIFLPIGAYSLTRNGRLSMGLTQPPLATEPLVILDHNNVIEPASIVQTRASASGRKFWNPIKFSYDFTDDGTATQVFEAFDANADTLIGFTQELPIDAPGARTEFGATGFFQKRAQLMLSRFARGATQITMQVNWGVGNTIEGGDIIAVRDDGGLQISNFNTGVRDLGFQLFEVIDRTLNIKDGRCQITLINGVGSQATDRYGIISPSSHVGPGSTDTHVQIIDSFGNPITGDEASKWESYFGDRILVHDENFTTPGEETILIGIDPINRRFLIVDPPLSTVPTSGNIVDLATYSTSPFPQTDQAAKVIHCFYSPDVSVSGGISNTSFDVSIGDVSKFREGFPILVHTEDFVTASPETVVTSVVGTTITVKDSLGFTPDSTMIASFLGFDDGGAAYRWL